MSIKQIIMNVSGNDDVFYELLELIENEDINILSLFFKREGEDFQLNLLTDNNEKVESIINDNNFGKIEKETVFIVELTNNSGSLNSIIQSLKDEEITVEKINPVFSDRKSLVLIKTDRINETKKILRSNWEKIIDNV